MAHVDLFASSIHYEISALLRDDYSYWTLCTGKRLHFITCCYM